jgi:hypothetical protein
MDNMGLHILRRGNTMQKIARKYRVKALKFVQEDILFSFVGASA